MYMYEYGAYVYISDRKQKAVTMNTEKLPSEKTKP